MGFALANCLKPADLYPFEKFPGLDPAKSVDEFLRNVRLTKYYSESLGARYFCFLQPYALSGKKPFTRFELASTHHIRRLETRDGNNLFNLNNQFYTLLHEKAGAEPDLGLKDLTGVFDGRTGEIYLDHVHLSDRGYDELAKKVAAEILASVKS